MADFAQAKTATVRMNVNVDENGNIAQSGDTVHGTKAVSIPGLKQAVNLDGADAVFSAIVGGIAGGTHDTASAVKITTQGVE